MRDALRGQEILRSSRALRLAQGFAGNRGMGQVRLLGRRYCVHDGAAPLMRHKGRLRLHGGWLPWWLGWRGWQWGPC